MKCLLRLSVTLTAVCLLSGQGFAVEIAGHRGASHDAPENTLAAVNLAWLRGADAVEIDVFLSKDGHVVVIHDKTTKRFGGTDRKVADQTLKELKSIDVGRWKNKKYTGERIPTLSEVLATIPPGKRLFIEIKAGIEILPAIQRVLKRSKKPPAQAALIGFSYETIAAAKKAMPQHTAYWVVHVKQDKQTRHWKPQLKEMVEKAKTARLDGLSLGNAPTVIDRAYVQTIKQAGLDVQVWTVNDADVARRLHDAGVDAITTDRPGWIKKRLDEAQIRIDVEQSNGFCQHKESPRRVTVPVATANKGPIP